MEIIIDTREKNRIEKATTYYKEYNHQLKISTQKLKTADYLFKDNDKTVAYEYKRIDDFMNSIKNQSLFEEISNQVKTSDYDYNYLIIQGSINKYLDNIWATVPRIRHTYKSKKDFNIRTKNVYDGAVRRCLSILPVIKVLHPEQAFKEMLLVSMKCLDDQYYGGSKRTGLVKTGDIISHMLIGADGVSQKKAKVIIDSLGVEYAEDLLVKTVDDFKSVKGVGKVTAEDIHKWLHKKQDMED